MSGLSCGMQVLSCSRHVGSSSLTRDGTQISCTGSMESYPVDHQGSPRKAFLKQTSNFGIILDLQKSCRESREGPYTPVSPLTLVKTKKLTLARCCQPHSRQILPVFLSTPGSRPGSRAAFSCHGSSGPLVAISQLNGVLAICPAECPPSQWPAVSLMKEAHRVKGPSLLILRGP